MHYASSRAHTQVSVGFADALLQGLAPDGGLYVPLRIPKLPEDWLEARSLADMGAKVLPAWLSDDFDAASIRAICDDALNFPTPLVDIGNGVQVLELFHGPTLSFKDVGARTMARMMNHLLEQRDSQLTILVATSGDTGSAVADGFAGLERIKVILLYPKGNVSPVQERQLIIRRDNVQAFAVEGDFDACQALVKAAFAHDALADVPLSSANSINIGRLVPQMLYYLWALCTVAQDSEAGFEEINICIPSGNLGNFTAGFLAHQAGMPVKQFVVAHNANHFFPEYLQAERDAFAYEPTVATVANAMDVGAPSNFERLHALFGDAFLREKLWATSVNDATILEQMQHIHKERNYQLCPHSAIAIEAIQRYRQQTGDNTPFISLATAHPAKFPEIAQRAGIPERREAALEKLWQLPTHVDDLANDVQAFIGRVREFALEN